MLAKPSMIPRTPINGVIISAVITIFVPLFKDTYGRQKRYVNSIKSWQIAF